MPSKDGQVREIGHMEGVHYFGVRMCGCIWLYVWLWVYRVFECVLMCMCLTCVSCFSSLPPPLVYTVFLCTPVLLYTHLNNLYII